MPELPEVETTRKGIEPFLVNQTIRAIHIHQSSLRWPISSDISSQVNQRILSVGRRGKYLLITTKRGTTIIHLGMSGSLRIAETTEALRKHDHVEFVLSNGILLRYHDPRRFGCVLYTDEDPNEHRLLVKLGPEPLSEIFDGEHLFRLSRQKKSAVKNFIMDSQVVVGVGNIYASESLFMAGIRPGKAAGRISRYQYNQLALAIREVLAKAIKMGGTTLRDFVNSDGNPGYFKQQLQVYGRAGEPCRLCGLEIKAKIIGQRSSFYCAGCQS